FRLAPPVHPQAGGPHALQAGGRPGLLPGRDRSPDPRPLGGPGCGFEFLATAEAGGIEPPRVKSKKSRPYGKLPHDPHFRARYEARPTLLSLPHSRTPLLEPFQAVPETSTARTPHLTLGVFRPGLTCPWSRRAERYGAKGCEERADW